MTVSDLQDVQLDDLNGPWYHGGATVLCTRLPRPDLGVDFWPLYEESFAPLDVRAAARHVLTEEEFAADMDDPRIWKYVALDAEGRPAGLTTLTDDFATMPWVSPHCYAHHYPDEWSRRAVFYCGISLVRPDLRLHPLFALMMHAMGQRVAASRGVVGYDVCGFNNRDRALGSLAPRILQRAAGFEVRQVDVQTYFVARPIQATEGAS